MKMDKKAVGQRIKDIRLNKGMTLEEFGKLFNATRSNVQSWEYGTALPNKERLKTLCKVADISLNDLFYGSLDEMFKNNIDIFIDAILKRYFADDEVLNNETKLLLIDFFDILQTYNFLKKELGNNLSIIEKWHFIYKNIIAHINNTDVILFKYLFLDNIYKEQKNIFNMKFDDEIEKNIIIFEKKARNFRKEKRLSMYDVKIFCECFKILKENEEKIHNSFLIVDTNLKNIFTVDDFKNIKIIDDEIKYTKKDFLLDMIDILNNKLTELEKENN